MVAKSRPTVTNLAVSVSTSSSSVNSPIASRSPGVLKAPSRQIGLSGRLGVSANQNSNPNAASSPQGWPKGCSTVHKHRRTCSNRYRSEVSESSGEINHKHRGACSNWVPRISRKSEKLQKIQNPKVEFGHIISVYHHIVLVSWRKSSCSETDG